MAYLSDITISISDGTLGLSNRSFDPLIVGSGAVASGVTTVYELTDLTDAGYTSSDAEYDMVSAMLAQTPRPQLIKVCRKATATDYDDYLDTIRVTDDAWYAVCIASRLDADLNSVGTWADSNGKFFFGCASGVAALSGRSVDRESYMIHTAPTDYPECAWVGRCLPSDPGSIDWKWKVLSGQTASTFTSSELTAIRAAHGNAIQSQAGVSFTNDSFTTSGKFIDVIMGRDWIEDQLKTDLLSMLINNNSIPYDDSGIAMVEAVVRGVLKRAGDNGLIAKASSAADMLQSDDKVYMFRVTVPLRSDTSSVDRANRTLTDVKFVYTVAGSIHEVEVTGTITV